MINNLEFIMLKSKKVLIPSVIIFCVIEATLGVLLQRAPYGYYYSFYSVVLACVFFILFAERSLSYILTQVALIATICADYFLVLLFAKDKLTAMIFFAVVQIAYFLRIYLEDESKKRRVWHIASRVILSVIGAVLTYSVLGPATDALALVSIFYYANLILNVVFAFLSFKRHSVLAIGLFLFFLCDTVIGLSLLNLYFPISQDSSLYAIIHPGFDLAWAFYLPSQTLIALSLLPKRLKKKS